MKIILITSAFIILITSVFGQNDSLKQQNTKWSIGTILMNEQNRYFSHSFRPKIFPGIVIKRNFHHFTIRFGIEYLKEYYKPSQTVIPYPDQLFVNGYLNEGMIRIGIEKGLVFKKYFKPYLALDLTGIKSYSDLTYNGGFAGVSDRIYTHLIGYGASPTLGIEFIITRNFSVAYETRFRLIYTKSTHDIDNLCDDAGTYRQTTTHFEKIKYRIGALTLFVNF